MLWFVDSRNFYGLKEFIVLISLSQVDFHVFITLFSVTLFFPAGSLFSRGTNISLSVIVILYF